MSRPTQPVWYSLITIVTALVAVAGAAIWYTDRTARESERKWCSVVATLDEAYRSTPPTTDIGRKLARDIAQLRAEFDCPR